MSTDIMSMPATKDRVQRVEPWETVLVIVGLLWVFGTIGGLLTDNTNRSGGSREVGSVLLQSINIAIYGGGLFFMVLQLPKWLGSAFMRAWPLVVLVGLTFISSFWSDSPDTTLRRSVGLMLTTSFAFYIVAHFSLKRFLTLLLVTLVIYEAAGILAVVVPRQGITPDGPLVGSWRGFTGMKNDFGRVLALILGLIVVFGATNVPWWRRVVAVGVPITLALLVLSQSKTSLVSAVATVLGAFFFRATFQGSWGRKVRFGPDLRAIVALVAIALLLFGVLVLLPAIVEALGRDLTLSGRTKLWAWAIGLNARNPFLGHGFRAFWIDANTKYFFEYFAWNSDPELGIGSNGYAGPANGHSGYIDTWLEMGYVGVAFLAIFIFSAIRRLAVCFQNGAMTAGYALSGILSYLLVYSVTERVVLQQSEGVWFLTMVFYLYADLQLQHTEEAPTTYLVAHSAARPE